MIQAAWLVLAAALSAEPALAQRKVSVQTKFDKFDIHISGSKGEINGKPADLTSLGDLLPLFNQTLPDACPTFKRPPDITVKDGAKVRTVYVEDGIVSDGKACITVSGEGLYYFPLHRDFLAGPKTDSIKLKSPVKIFVQGKKLLELKKQGDTWVSDAPDLMVDWDFISKLEDSLKRFDIRLRVQTGIGKDKQKVIIQNGPETLEFYKVTAVMWALKKPGQSWLVASDDWSFWRDFDASVYEDRFAADIRAILAATDGAAKRQMLDKLENNWSRNLRDMYHKLALNENEEAAIRALALKRLKSKPALETAGVMVQLLTTTTNDEIRDDAAVILKLNYPKGPKFKSADPPEERQKALDFWKNWWQQKQNAR